MYKRCIIDKSGLEPKSLFHMVQFLMYCKKDKYTITVEDILELLYVRVGRANLDDEIQVIFGYCFGNKRRGKTARRLGKADRVQRVPGEDQ